MSKQQELIDDLTNRMNNNIKNYKTNPEDEKELLDFFAKFPDYSARNNTLLQTQYKNAQGVKSYKEFQEEGYQVQKGEKALRILAPKIQKTFLDENNEEKFLNQANKKEKKQIKNKELKVSERVVGFVAVPVFDITQTDCPPEDYPKLFPNRPEKFKYKGTKSELNSLEKAIHNYAKENNIAIQYGKTDSAAKGYYRPSQHSIMIKDTLPKTEQVKVLLHEIGHAEMHNNNAMKEKGEVKTSIKEYQAEMTAYVTSKMFDLDTENSSTNYMANWTKRDVDDKEYMTSLNEVKKVSNNLANKVMDKYNSIENSKGREPILSDEKLQNQKELTDNHIAMKSKIFKNNEFSYYEKEKDQTLKATHINVERRNGYTHNIITLKSDSERSYTAGIDTTETTTKDLKQWKKGMTGKEWLNTDIKTDIIKDNKENISKITIQDYDENKSDIELENIDKVIDERTTEKNETLSI